VPIAPTDIQPKVRVISTSSRPNSRAMKGAAALFRASTKPQ
jgi:hypothetical protein